MIYILKNKQLYLIIFLSLIVGAFLGDFARNNFFEIYIGNIGNISIRYFLIISSVALEYIISKSLYSSCIISRYNNKKSFLIESIRIEVILSFILFSIFNLMVLIFALPMSLNYFADIFAINANILLIYITVSMFIKCLNIIIKTNYITSICFIFIYVCIDFVLEHFNFFYFDCKLFNLESVYRLVYAYKNGVLYFFLIILFDLVLLVVLLKNNKRRDYLLKNDDEI